MASQGMPKMSLCAQYDDLCRYVKVLTAGSEPEFKIFVESQLACVRKLKESETDVRELKRKIASLESEKGRLETQMKHLRNLCESEVNKRKAVEKEKNSMERQIALIKEVLLADSNMDNQTKEKLAFLSSSCKPSMNSPPRLETIEESVGSLLSLSDVDRTEDDLEPRHSSHRRTRRSKGKRSSSEKKTSPKKIKSDTTEPESEDNDLPENGNLPYPIVGVRSNSEPTSQTPDIRIITPVHRSESDQFKFNTYDCRRSNTGSLTVGTPVGRYSTGHKLSRCHSFSQKTAIRTEKCHPCGRSIKFCKMALKCQDCRVICHPECKDLCPIPCIPTINTPTKGTVGSIVDYTSSTPPMIPALIVHCVNEIESRGLREIGLYRVPGAEREVKDLKEKFLKGRAIPNLNQVEDTHAICGTVKEFLRFLKEPLIPRSAWQAFVDAAELSDIALSLNVLYEAVMDLPQPNRDTLSFLILHLHRVAESPHTKMPIENLAKIFGPTIVGYSTSEPSQMLHETPCQHKVMQRLLSISSDSWQSLLNFETDVFQPLTSTHVKTPETTPAPRVTRLGPIYAANSNRPRNMTLGKLPLTPRNSKYSKSGKMMHFSSPLLK